MVQHTQSGENQIQVDDEWVLSSHSLYSNVLDWMSSGKSIADSPGPTDYTTPNNASGPSFTIGAKAPDKPPRVEEGVNALHISMSGPAYTILGRPKVHETSQNPGPGHFYSERPFPRPLGEVVSLFIASQAKKNQETADSKQLRTPT